MVAAEPMKPPKVLPPHYFFLALATMLALGYLSQAPLFPGDWYLIGVIPILLGLIFAGGAARQFFKAQTNIVPLTESTTLVTDGMFAVTRNPMYVGMVAVLVGTALLLNNPWPWVAIVPFWLVIRFAFVQHEEVLMVETFGEQYAAYKARVRRWL